MMLPEFGSGSIQIDPLPTISPLRRRCAGPSLGHFYPNLHLRNYGSRLDLRISCIKDPYVSTRPGPELKSGEMVGISNRLAVLR